MESPVDTEGAIGAPASRNAASRQGKTDNNNNDNRKSKIKTKAPARTRSEKGSPSTCDAIDWPADLVEIECDGTIAGRGRDRLVLPSTDDHRERATGRDQPPATPIVVSVCVFARAATDGEVPKVGGVSQNRGKESRTK